MDYGGRSEEGGIDQFGGGLYITVAAYHRRRTCVAAIAAGNVVLWGAFFGAVSTGNPPP